MNEVIALARREGSLIREHQRLRLAVAQRIPRFLFAENAKSLFTYGLDQARGNIV